MRTAAVGSGVEDSPAETHERKKTGVGDRVHLQQQEGSDSYKSKAELE